MLIRSLYCVTYLGELMGGRSAGLQASRSRSVGSIPDSFTAARYDCTRANGSCAFPNSCVAGSPDEAETVDASARLGPATGAVSCGPCS